LKSLLLDQNATKANLIYALELGLKEPPHSRFREDYRVTTWCRCHLRGFGTAQQQRFI
jgi:hypothetical protein